MSAPRITIITPVFNRANMIAEAIDSVARQGYPAVEHIVIDGGSTDGTVEILRRTPGIIWQSEPDRGLYDAINKGIRMATGDIIGHLNSDDIYLPGTLAAVAEGFTKDRAAEAACGGAEVIQLLAHGNSRRIRTWRRERIKRLGWHDVTLGVPITNARFFRRSWYRRAGFYNLRYRLAADREFLIRSMMLGMHTVPLERTVYQYRQHPESLTISGKGMSQRLHEEYLALARHYMLLDHSPEPLRRMAKRWYAVEVARRLIRQGRARDWEGFRHTLGESRVELPGWPLRLVLEAACRLTGGCR
jgi:glycosyltransferase involved in cell wall biosynthesis